MTVTELIKQLATLAEENGPETLVVIYDNEQGKDFTDFDVEANADAGETVILLSI